MASKQNVSIEHIVVIVKLVRACSIKIKRMKLWLLIVENDTLSSFCKKVTYFPTGHFGPVHTTTGEVEKGSIISLVRSSVHTNPEKLSTENGAFRKRS